MSTMSIYHIDFLMDKIFYLQVNVIKYMLKPNIKYKTRLYLSDVAMSICLYGCVDIFEFSTPLFSDQFSIAFMHVFELKLAHGLTDDKRQKLSFVRAIATTIFYLRFILVRPYILYDKIKVARPKSLNISWGCYVLQLNIFMSL